MLVTGANGAGKTNLLESLHVGTQGFSPRTRADQQLVRFGAAGARIALAGDRDGRPVELEVTLQQQAGKRAKLNGAPLRSAEQLRGEVATLVFTPDRLAVVKGGPAARRAYFDRSLSRLLPSRAALPLEYAAAVGQRNAALRRVAFGASTRDAVAPWTEQVATLGASLVASRQEAIALLSPVFAERADELGLPGAALDYGGEPPTVAALEARLERDLERGVTGLGPHLDDVTVRSGERDLRSFGSQGEQRLAVLSLLLAEAEVIAEQRRTPPLVLLDDVLSELDATRRRALAERIGRRRTGDRDRDERRRAAARPRAAARSDPRRGESRLMDRLDRQIRRELGRIGPMDGDMTAIVRVWPAAVGETVARNACPARLARDGTLHVNTASATWAFELGSLAPTILEQLRNELGEAAPPKLRFAPGPIPDPLAESPEQRGPVAARGRCRGPRRGGSALAAVIEDEELRELVSRAAAAGLARARSDRGF